MNPKKRLHGSQTFVPINIDDCGQAHPAHAPISESKDGGAKFTVTYDLTLVFDPAYGCPFQNCSGCNLALSQGTHDEPLKPGTAGRTYPYAVNPSQKPGHPCVGVFDDPFDVVVGS